MRPVAGAAAAALVALALAASAAAAPSPGERLLARLPRSPDLARIVLLGDVGRLRRAYPAEGIAQASSGLWLPDALVDAGSRSWADAFGFGLDGVATFAAGGFHPRSAMVATGTFDIVRVGDRLARRGYVSSAGMQRLGADGSIDVGTKEGQLALSALARVVVAPGRLVAASTTTLATRARQPAATLASDPDLAAAARALGPFTAAALIPADGVDPPLGRVYTPLPQHRAAVLGIALDDRGPSHRQVRIALVYATAAEARADAGVLRRTLPRAGLVDEPGTTFGELLVGLTVSARERAVVVDGTLGSGRPAWLWHSLVERGALSTLVRQGR